MDKAALRKEFLQKRLVLTQNEVEKKSLLITEKTVHLLKDKSFQTIHTFLPQRNKNEVDTWKIISKLRISFPHVDIIVPYVIPSTREMEHYLLTEETLLIENRWGIPEPDPLTEKRVSTKILDIILIPLLAFDKAGYRVGYGGGFYDRFLIQCRSNTFKIGLSLFEPVGQIEDLNQFDIKMDACITPSELLYW